MFFSAVSTATPIILPNNNCQLLTPPETAGETQAHGVILYIYPRSHTINSDYTGCQSQWFLDDDYYRKLSVVHYAKGLITGYDNIQISGDYAYQCHYENKLLTIESDRRCPTPERLKKKTYQAGCYSKSKLNKSDPYEVAFDYCKSQ